MANKFSDIVKQMPPERQEKIKVRAKEIRADYHEARRLRDIRKALSLTQTELAKRLMIQQAAVSKIESQTDTYVSTLRRVIAALGGELHIIASFPDDQNFEIDQFSSPIRKLAAQE